MESGFILVNTHWVANLKTDDVEYAVSLERRLNEVLLKLEQLHSPGPRAYSKAEASVLLGISRKELGVLIKNGSIKPVTYPGLKKQRIPSLEITRLTTPKSFLPALELPGPSRVKRVVGVEKTAIQSALLRCALKRG